VPPPDTLPIPGCPDVLRLFSKHLEGDIDAQLCAQLEAHLQRCPRCRRTCDSLKQTLRLCRSAGSADDASAKTEVPLAVQGRVRVALRDFLAQTA
jgi:RNA polymerase sigma-70 factor, ECF subfamily